MDSQKVSAEQTQYREQDGWLIDVLNCGHVVYECAPPSPIGCLVTCPACTQRGAAP